MADFTLVQARLDSLNKAAALLEEVRQTYRQAKTVQAKLALYTGGTDPDFNQAIDNIFDAGERAELNQMLTQVDTLISNWDANHSVLLGV